MESAIAILNLLNTATPGIASLILLIRRKDGTISVVATLNEADASFDANIVTAQAWLSAHKPAV